MIEHQRNFRRAKVPDRFNELVLFALHVDLPFHFANLRQESRHRSMAQDTDTIANEIETDADHAVRAKGAQQAFIGVRRNTRDAFEPAFRGPNRRNQITIVVTVAAGGIDQQCMGQAVRIEDRGKLLGGAELMGLRAIHRVRRKWKSCRVEHVTVGINCIAHNATWFFSGSPA